MRTTEPLTEQDLKILKELKATDKIVGIICFIVGTILAIQGVFLLSAVVHDRKLTGFIIFMGLALLVFGVYLVSNAIRLHLKNRAYRLNPPHGNVKQIISDKMFGVSIIDKKYLRYHFQGDTIDAYTLIGTGHPPRRLKYGHIVQQFKALHNTPLTLTIVEFKPGLNLVLDARYSNYTSTEYIRPLEEGDRQKALSEYRFAAGCFIAMGIVATIVINTIVVKSPLQYFWFTLVLPLSMLVLLSLYLYRTKRKAVNDGENKIIIHTTVTEAIDILMKAGKTSHTYPYYRLADGLVVHIGKTGHSAGERVIIEYLQKKNGKKGELIDMRSI